jgi:hypothetical protein
MKPKRTDQKVDAGEKMVEQLDSSKARRVGSFDAVREIGLSLPDVIDGTAYGAPALKLRGKLVACVPTNKSAEPNCAVVRIGLERRAELLRQHPEIYYVTDHYAPHPTVLVRLAHVTRGELIQVLREACAFASPAQAGSTRSRRAKKKG